MLWILLQCLRAACRVLMPAPTLPHSNISLVHSQVQCLIYSAGACHSVSDHCPALSVECTARVLRGSMCQLLLRTCGTAETGEDQMESICPGPRAKIRVVKGSTQGDIARLSSSHPFQSDSLWLVMGRHEEDPRR